MHFCGRLMWRDDFHCKRTIFCSMDLIKRFLWSFHWSGHVVRFGKKMLLWWARSKGRSSVWILKVSDNSALREGWQLNESRHQCHWQHCSFLVECHWEDNQIFQITLTIADSMQAHFPLWNIGRAKEGFHHLSFSHWSCKFANSESSKTEQTNCVELNETETSGMPSCSAQSKTGGRWSRVPPSDFEICLTDTFPHVSTVLLTPFLKCELSHWHLHLHQHCLTGTFPCVTHIDTCMHAHTQTPT